jgi:hypothetical protein
MLSLNTNSTMSFSGRIFANETLSARMPVGLDMGIPTGDLQAIEVTARDNSGSIGPALMAFHRPGQYAVYFGVDTDNKLKIGGWSLLAIKHEVLHSGNVSSYVLGNGQDRTSFNNTQRLFNQDYTNNTSRPRTIFVNSNSASGSRTMQLIINGVVSASDIAVSASCHATVWGVIQPGEVYRVNTTGGFVHWSELY